jgi:hypothetical protein
MQCPSQFFPILIPATSRLLSVPRSINKQVPKTGITQDSDRLQAAWQVSIPGSARFILSLHHTGRL